MKYEKVTVMRFLGVLYLRGLALWDLDFKHL